MLNPFLRIPRIGLIIFFTGFSAGFILTLLLPEIGKANYAFQINQANWLKTLYTGKERDLHFISLIIFLRNLMIALLLAISPLVLIQYILKYRSNNNFKNDHLQKLKSEISKLLSLYSLSVLFTYGFLVYGLFFGFILIEKSVHEFVLWLIYFIPHGILETLGIILAASTALIMRNIWLKNPENNFQIFWKKIPNIVYIKYLIILITIILISSLIEVNISNKLLESVITK